MFGIPAGGVEGSGLMVPRWVSIAEALAKPIGLVGGGIGFLITACFVWRRDRREAAELESKLRAGLDQPSLRPTVPSPAVQRALPKELLHTHVEFRWPIITCGILTVTMWFWARHGSSVVGTPEKIGEGEDEFWVTVVPDWYNRGTWIIEDALMPLSVTALAVLVAMAWRRDRYRLLMLRQIAVDAQREDA